MIADTPEPPYYAVIFTSVRTEVDNGYEEMDQRMMELAPHQDGFLGIESAREEIGITVSYWRDMESIQKWSRHAEHIEAKRRAREEWYKAFRSRIAKVESDRSFNRKEETPEE